LEADNMVNEFNKLCNKRESDENRLLEEMFEKLEKPDTQPELKPVPVPAPVKVVVHSEKKETVITTNLPSYIILDEEQEPRINTNWKNNTTFVKSDTAFVKREPVFIKHETKSQKYTKQISQCHNFTKKDVHHETIVQKVNITSQNNTFLAETSWRSTSTIKTNTFSTRPTDSIDKTKQIDRGFNKQNRSEHVVSRVKNATYSRGQTTPFAGLSDDNWR
jgi:hypothetical protein